MYANSVTAIKGTSFLFQSTGGSSKTIPHFRHQTWNSNFPSLSDSFGGCSFRYDSQSVSTSVNGALFKDFKIGFGRLELNIFRVPSVLVGGSDGTGGFEGPGSGGGGGGSDEDGYGFGGNGKPALFQWYLTLLEKYPVWTKSITCAFLNLFGDLMCQLLLDKGKPIDGRRVFLFTMLGLILVGPTLHFWYLYLNNLITAPGTAGAFFRILLDQFVFAPIFTGLFMATLLTCEGRSFEILRKLKEDWVSAVIANWILWIPFQFLNFRFVSQQFQVLVSNLIALIWNVALSFLAHKLVPEELGTQNGSHFYK